MTPRRLLILGALALVALVTSLLLSNHRSSSPQQAAAFYPELKQQIDSVNAVRIFKAGDALAVELVRKESGWTISERSGYPADRAKVNKLLLALAQAKPVEEKTSNPESYPALGVEDPSNATATSVRVELEGPATPVKLIVGKSGTGAQSAYVRRAGEPASWLINQRLDASTNPAEWLHTEIVDVAADRMQSATVAVGSEKPYSATKKSRADADFAVDSLPKGKQLASPGAANSAASALAALTLADVRPQQEFAAEKPAAHATLRTFDGLVAELDGWVKDGKHYIAAKTTYDPALAQKFHVETKAPEPAAADASNDASGKKPDGAAPAPAATQVTAAEKTEDGIKAINARVAGWVYEIPEYKYEAIFKTMDSMLKK